MTKKYSSAHPDPIDKHVGSRIRQKRTLLGISQEKMADALGITFQQVQKYENGTNRVGSSRLYNISKILKSPVGFFFEGLNNIQNTSQLKVAEGKSPFDNTDDILNSQETINLVRSYYAIKDQAVRKKIQEMIKSLA